MKTNSALSLITLPTNSLPASQQTEKPTSINRQANSETVNDDVLLAVDLLVHQEITHVRSLVSLQLNDLPVLLVIHNRAVARETPLPRLQNQLQVQIRRQTLHCRDALSPISLLNANVCCVKNPLSPLPSLRICTFSFVVTCCVVISLSNASTPITLLSLLPTRAAHIHQRHIIH